MAHDEQNKFMPDMEGLVYIGKINQICLSHSRSIAEEIAEVSQIHHQPINVPTAGAQAFLFGLPTRRTDHSPPRGPSEDWWVLMTANAAGTNGLTCLPKHGGARNGKVLVIHPKTDH
jgi:hypothetical protein